MKSILVSGASGIVGYGILRGLRNSGEKFRLIGATLYADSPAQAFCDIFEQCPMASDARYMDWLVGVIGKHDIELVIPGIEADMYQWADNLDRIEQTGARAVLNRPGLISLCRDKWKFYERLRECRSPHAIETSLDGDFETLAEKFGLPFLLKPRSGYASRGIVKVSDRQAFSQHQEKMGNVLMAQPIVGDDEHEYSTSAFCDGDGGFYASMSLRRKLSQEGFTEKAEAVREPDGISDLIHSALSGLCREFKPVGPTNFQFRLHDGGLKLLEINPRISSSTSFRAGFGYNEAGMAASYYLEGRRPEQPRIRAGRAVRYVEDLFYYEDRADF